MNIFCHVRSKITVNETVVTFRLRVS